ncbi:CD209 antigen-like protein E [Scomber scombrus]|uniref:CD209 antigen-like protein E n=1 Tax=Scomber scombrus TaxID=13677 RepID=UPI002DD8C5A4|nr:CD209 antigen-like protein E [Scomber scombrus]
MERRDISDCNFDGGFNTLICQEDLNIEEHHPDQDRQQVSMSNMIPSKLVAVSLALLAAVFLMIDIGLGVHYNKLTDNHLTLDDTEQISSELLKLQDSYKTAVETMKSANKQLDSEMSRQKPTNWEFEHQKKRTEEYEVQVDKTKKDIDTMRHHLPMINDGCKHCPPGWILRNSICYYFAFSEYEGLKSWQNARDYCQLYGGDLAVIDSKDKENFTINHVFNKKSLKPKNGYWIGLRDVHEEGTWKWLDGKVLVEGYWIDGEPNNVNEEDCVSVLPKENFFQAWNDAPCTLKLKWICEKALTNISS